MASAAVIPRCRTARAMLIGMDRQGADPGLALVAMTSEPWASMKDRPSA